MESEQNRRRWRPGKRDAIFIAIVATVVVILSLGSKERRTAATPNDDVHRQAISRDACLSCHGPAGVRPQPLGHTRADQCFQCHLQPQGWLGAGR